MSRIWESTVALIVGLALLVLSLIVVTATPAQAYIPLCNLNQNGTAVCTMATGQQQWFDNDPNTGKLCKVSKQKARGEQARDQYGRPLVLVYPSGQPPYVCLVIS